MAARDKDIEYIQQPRLDGWMTTFSDMVTLLITFFVLLISMMSMDNKSFRDVFGFFNEAVGPLEFTAEQEVNGLPSLTDPVAARIFLDTTSLNRSLLNAMANKAVGGISGRGVDPFEVKNSRRGLAIRVPGDVLFAEGSGAIDAAAFPILMSIAAVVGETDSVISIEGHTDDLGGQDANWKLSLQRSLAVIDYFVYEAGMSPTRFVMCGYGETRPETTNATEQGRARNRRVEIILLRDRI